MLPEETDVDSFTVFVKEVEPRLKRALCAAFGTEAGVEATRDALAYGWKEWERVREMDNPAGYLYRVGRSRARPYLRRRPVFPAVPVDRMPWVEPGLPKAIRKLTEQQRVSVVLTQCFDWTFAEVAELLGVSRSTVQQHVERALDKLSTALGGQR